MKKNILIAIGIAFGLFIYGYLASTAGHDHDSHGHDKVQVNADHSEQGHGDHEH